MILYRINVTKLILVFGLFRDECAAPVPKPSITYTCNETACTLSCDGKDAKHTSWKLLWKENDKESSGERVLTVWKSDHLNKTYTCIWRNPLNEATSESISEKDLFPQNSLQGKSWILILAVFVLAFAVLVITGVSRYCRVLRRTEAMNIIYENTKELRVQEHYQSGVTGADVSSVDDTVKGSQVQNHQCSAVTV
nr:uncharacterized protein LOC111847968 isoform X2 [Paramormyrops kingsleyae]